MPSVRTYRTYLHFERIPYLNLKAWCLVRLKISSIKRRRGTRQEKTREKSGGESRGIEGNALELFSVSFIRRYVTVVLAVQSNWIDIEHVYLPGRLK